MGPGENPLVQQCALTRRLQWNFQLGLESYMELILTRNFCTELIVSTKTYQMKSASPGRSLINSLKRPAFGWLCLVALTGFLFAQGFSGNSQHPKFLPQTRLPLDLPEAYGLAISRIGVVSNKFHCVSATRIDPTNDWATGWTFMFSNTNGVRASVKVYFNKDVWVDPTSAALLK